MEGLLFDRLSCFFPQAGRGASGRLPVLLGRKQEAARESERERERDRTASRSLSSWTLFFFSRFLFFFLGGGVFFFWGGGLDRFNYFGKPNVWTFFYSRSTQEVSACGHRCPRFGVPRNKPNKGYVPSKEERHANDLPKPVQPRERF